MNRDDSTYSATVQLKHSVFDQLKGPLIGREINQRRTSTRDCNGSEKDWIAQKTMMLSIKYLHQKFPRKMHFSSWRTPSRTIYIFQHKLCHFNGEQITNRREKESRKIFERGENRRIRLKLAHRHKDLDTESTETERKIAHFLQGGTPARRHFLLFYGISLFISTTRTHRHHSTRLRRDGECGKRFSISENSDCLAMLGIKTSCTWRFLDIRRAAVWR